MKKRILFLLFGLLGVAIVTVRAGEPTGGGEPSNPPNKPMMKTTSSINAAMVTQLNQALAQLQVPQELSTQPNLMEPPFPVLVEESSAIKALRDSARIAFASLEQRNRFFAANSFKPDDLLDLPIGLTYSSEQPGDNSNVFLALTKATLYKDYAEISAFIRIQLPGVAQRTLFFGADKLKFSYEGGLLEGRLVLLGDIEIPIKNMRLILRGAMDRATGEFGDLTYVQFGCGEFQGIQVTASLEFPRTLLKPIDPNTGLVKGIGLVEGQVRVFIKSFNDLLAAVTLPPFAVTGFEKVGFILNAATFDFSDRVNPEDARFPQKVIQNLPTPQNPNSWRGVYIKDILVLLPREFKKRGNNDRLKTKVDHSDSAALGIGGKEIFIDPNGFSGGIYATNVMRLNEGTASGWSMSLDKIIFRFEANKLVGGGLAGKLALPLTNDEDSSLALGYSGMIDQSGNYFLSISTREDIPFNVLRAKARLEKNSSITLGVVDGKFRPFALLNGSMNIATNKDGNEYNETVSNKPQIHFKGVVFRQLMLQTEAPYIRVSYMGYQDSTKTGNFSVGISRFQMVTNTAGDQAQLRLGMNVNLDGGEIGASGGFALKFKYVDRVNSAEEDDKKWVFDGVKFEELGLKGGRGPFKFEGRIALFEDNPIYGTGFGGCVKVNVDGKKTKFDLSVSVLFGAKPTYKYWYTDALANLGNGIPLFAGLTMNGFGGGAYYHMQPIKNPPPTPAGCSASFGQAGIGYIPNDKYLLGLKAVVTLKGFSAGSVSFDSFDGLVGFEMLVNSRGGLSSIGFFGEGELAVKASALPAWGDRAGKIVGKLKTVVEKIDDKLPISEKNRRAITGLSTNDMRADAAAVNGQPKPNDNKILFDLALLVDFENDVLDGSSNVYINFPSAGMRGVGPYGRAGWFKIHFDRNTWYMYLGRPDDPLGVQVEMGPIRSQTTMYFMAGKNLPAAGPPPARVLEIVGLDARTYNSRRDTTLLANGNGLALGMSLEASFGVNIVAYADVYIGIGFDMMMRRLDENVLTESCKKEGVYGWYADGQFYAALQASIGLKIGFVKLKAVSVSAGVLLIAQLPRPSYLYGRVNAQVRVLGKQVSLPFDVKVGKQCL